MTGRAGSCPGRPVCYTVLMPAAKTQICLPPPTKAEILRRFPNDTLEKLLEEFAPCEAGKPKRAPSERNIFMGQCMKEHAKARGAPEAMKLCSAKWKQQKGGK